MALNILYNAGHIGIKGSPTTDTTIGVWSVRSSFILGHGLMRLRSITCREFRKWSGTNFIRLGQPHNWTGKKKEPYHCWGLNPINCHGKQTH